MSGNIESRRKIIIYWFSGTGNTLWAARIFATEISRLGHVTELVQVPCQVAETFPEDATIGIFFPVYGQTIPVFMDEWISKLPKSTYGNPVFAMSTLAGFSGLVKGPLHSRLAGKGYRPFAIMELIMPCNYIRPDSDQEKINGILKKAEKEIANFAEAVHSGTCIWPWRPAILNLIQFWSVKIDKWLFPWLGRKFFADGDKCTRCGICSQLCPVGNITPGEDKLPSWDGKCQQCLRCINFCPQAAIDSRRMRFLFHPAYRCPGVKATELICSHHGRAGQD